MTSILINLYYFCAIKCYCENNTQILAFIIDDIEANFKKSNNQIIKNLIY